MKRKFKSCLLILFSVLMTGSLLIKQGNIISAEAIEEKDYKILLKQGSKIATYSGYKRYEGFTFNMSPSKSVSYSESSAIVLNVENCNITEKTAFAFYVNGLLMNATSDNNLKTYLYDQNIHTGDVVHKAYSVGYYSGNGVIQNYDYIVIPVTNFLLDGPSFDFESFTIAIRLQGIDISYSNPNFAIRGIYVINNFVINRALDLSSFEKVYTPSLTNFTAFDSGNSGITLDCITATYSEESFANVNINSENGTVVYNSVLPGGDMVLRAKPDDGYKLYSMRVNGNLVETNKYGQYLIKNVPSLINVDAVFIKETTFNFEQGSFYSLYNHWCGTVYSDFDSVNLTTISNTDELPNENKYVGFSMDGFEKNVLSTDFIAVQIQTNDTVARSFYLTINGVQPSRQYFVIDRLGNVARKQMSLSALKVDNYTRYTNATLDIGYNVEGFSGYIVVPLKNYDSVTTINSLSIYTGTKTKYNARFNVGNIYVTSSFNELCPNEFKDNELLWKPGVDNFNPYIHEGYDYTSELTRIGFLKKNEIFFDRREPNEEDPDKNYDEYYMTLPFNTIGDDGYVDLEKLNIKGIVFDVLNNNDSQITFAIRLGSSETTRLIYGDNGVWQTSIAQGYQNKIIYDNGIVRQRAPAFFPYDENGSFKGKVFIPLSSSAFITGGESRSFPTKIQPLFRIIMKGVPLGGYDAFISNFCFVTDESPYKENIINLFPINGKIVAYVGDTLIEKGKYDKVLDNTEINFTVIPDEGYSIGPVSVISDEIEKEIQPDSEGVYHYVVTNETNILFQGLANTYKVYYDLNGGTNNPENPESFIYGSPSIELKNPTNGINQFDHWEDDNGKVVSKINTFTASDIYLKAIWKPNLGLIIGVSAGGLVLVGGVVTVVLIVRKRKIEK